MGDERLPRNLSGIFSGATAQQVEEMILVPLVNSGGAPQQPDKLCRVSALSWATFVG
jgi:hypothetical protein